MNSPYGLSRPIGKLADNYNIDYDYMYKFADWYIHGRSQITKPVHLRFKELSEKRNIPISQLLSELTTHLDNIRKDMIDNA